jgi:hypothetical protein
MTAIHTFIVAVLFIAFVVIAIAAGTRNIRAGQRMTNDRRYAELQEHEAEREARWNAAAAYDRVTPPTDEEVRDELERRKRVEIVAVIDEAVTEIVNLSDSDNPVAVRLAAVRKLLQTEEVRFGDE